MLATSMIDRKDSPVHGEWSPSEASFDHHSREVRITSTGRITPDARMWLRRTPPRIAADSYGASRRGTAGCMPGTFLRVAHDTDGAGALNYAKTGLGRLVPSEQ